MTAYKVRSDPASELPRDQNVLVLDWHPGRSSSTIQIGRQAGARFFDGWRAPREALDLFLLGATAYCVDKTSIRRSATDHWTRELDVELPVESTDVWSSARLAPVLDFLTGDSWNISPYHEPRSPLAELKRVPDGVTPVADVDAVCLFSGGLDSLTGSSTSSRTNPPASFACSPTTRATRHRQRNRTCWQHYKRITGKSDS
ncbi:hypothetical protein GCM10029992_35890 [Glycomyces albus]